MASTYNQEYGFGAGSLYATQTNLSTGLPTPVEFGAVQDVSIDFSAEMKEVYGKGQYALALARGKAKIDIKAKFAQIFGRLFNSVYFNGTLTAAAIKVAESESNTVASGTFTVANSATFLADLGLVYYTTGLLLTRTASASPAVAGTYYSSAGTYKLNTGDNTKVILATYSYTAASGAEIQLPNPRMGVTPTFSMVFHDLFDGKECTLTLNNCVANKLSLPSKLDDWLISEIDFSCSADANGNVGVLSFAQ